MKFDWQTATRRERAAAIAEHVMGWKVGYYYGVKAWKAENEIVSYAAPDDTHDPNHVFEPDIDHNDVALVIEKMKNYHLTIIRRPSGSFNVQFRPENLDGWDATARGLEIRRKSLPEAICLAALRACGVDAVASTEEEGGP